MIRSGYAHDTDKIGLIYVTRLLEIRKLSHDCAKNLKKTNYQKLGLMTKTDQKGKFHRHRYHFLKMKDRVGCAVHFKLVAAATNWVAHHSALSSDELRSNETR